MKTTQILYLIIFIGVIISIVTSSHLLDVVQIDGFQDSPVPVNSQSEPRRPKTLEPTRLSMQAMPNSSAPATLPYGPYLQQAAIGSYQYQDPAQLPAELKQMKQLYEDLRSFLVFEGVSVSNSSDPTVQLPLTQLRADSSKLQQEISVLENNAGIQSTLTQQNLADIQEALTFLQRKVRLFQTSGVISGGVEGFADLSAPTASASAAPVAPKTVATEQDLMDLQTKIYGAILILTSSGTIDPVVMARVKRLQDMYSAISDMINKLDNGTWTAANIPVYKEDINTILPNLPNPQMPIMDILSQAGTPLSPVQQQLAGLVGKENAESVFNGLKDNGMFRVNVELGYNVPGSKNSAKPMMYSKVMNLGSDGRMENTTSVNADTNISSQGLSNLQTDSPFDTVTPGVEDKSIKMVGGLDWKQRGESICEQVRLRGLDPQDFGCIAKGSVMSPAYSWRGHTKMVCGRLAATMDPGLPVSCGCPPPNWAGWTISHCPSLPPYLNKSSSNSKC
jgi:hypothetical protein